jgi:hypothetical protein
VASDAGESQADAGFVAGDCLALSEPGWASKCESFVDNERRYVFPALEELSGVDLHQCFDKIRISFREDNQDGGGLADAFVDAPGGGRLEYTLTLAEGLFSADAGDSVRFDIHEPLHLLYDCLGVPYLANYHHTFFFPVQAEASLLIAAHGGPAHATATAEDLQGSTAYWADYSKSHPELLDEPGGPFEGCYGAETLALFAQYGTDGGALVRAFFSALRAARGPARVDPNDWGMPEEQYHALVKRLLRPGPATARIDQYCSGALDGGAQ